MQHIEKSFYTLFGTQGPIHHYFSPGRVNIIGEHIDYNGGFVFPAAINVGTHGIFRLRNDRVIRMFSNNYPADGIITIDLDRLTFDKRHGWANYAKGVVYEFILRKQPIQRGFDLYVHGTMPTSSGLSSSASLELLVSYALNDIFNCGYNRVELALLSQMVENTYMGMHCGIMDQLAISMGEKGKALLMNTATYETKAVGASFEGYDWVIMNTNYPRKMTDSKYNVRRAECERALAQVQLQFPIQHLCELPLSDLPQATRLVNDANEKKRLHHVVTEQHRTIAAFEALDRHDVYSFARLMNESHHSLQHDYEVTGIHLDVLVEAALEHGAIGARVTGAGFGGCAIALVPQWAKENMIIQVTNAYYKSTQLVATFLSVEFVQGVHRIYG